MIKVDKAWKAVIGAVGGLAAVASDVVTDELIGLDELGQLGTAAGVLALTVYGVWRVPNSDDDPVGDAQAKLVAALDRAAEFGRIAEEQARALRGAAPRKLK